LIASQNPTELYLVNFVAYNNLVNGSGDMDSDLLEPAREILERTTICRVVYYVAKLSEVKEVR
jgi:hypothetical protein